MRMVDMATVFQESDVVSVHCPLTPETCGLVDAGWLSSMKKTAYLINTSRGPVINEADLARALDAGQIAGAGLDVLSEEPPKADNPLLSAKNCFVTPHIAWASRASRNRLLATVAATVRAGREGVIQSAGQLLPVAAALRCRSGREEMRQRSAAATGKEVLIKFLAHEPCAPHFELHSRSGSRGQFALQSARGNFHYCEATVSSYRRRKSFS